MKFSKWRKVDLHLHSNASHDCTQTPPDIVDKIIENEINLFAITDHNNVDNVDEFRKIVDEKKANSINVEFLPGIELRTDRGKDGVAIHLIVIFPENFTKQTILDKFLSSDDIKLTRTHLIEKGKSKAPEETNDEKLYKIGCEVETVSFSKVIKLADELNCFTIAAHPKDRAGVEKELDYMQRAGDSFAELIIESVNSIKIMELPKPWEKAKLNRSFYLNDQNNFIKTMPSILCSDAHELEKIGSRFSWIKMDVINFNGLQQILFDPKHRIYIGETKPTLNNPNIISIKASGGYYKDIELNFSPELNCIIGGRGSGKSVIIDLIRFVFDKYDKDDNDFLDRIYNLLRHTNNVGLTYSVNSETQLLKTRTLDLSKNDTTYTDNSISTEIEIDVDIFSQGKLKEITKKADEKIKLIDEIGGNQELLSALNSTAIEIAANSNIQIKLVDSVTDLLDTASNKVQLIADIKTIESLLKDEEIKEFQIIEEDKKYYDLLLKNINEYKSQKNKFIEENAELLNIDFPKDPSERLKNIKDVAEVIFTQISQKEEEVLDSFTLLLNEIRNLKVDDNSWDEFYENKLSDYNAYLKRKGAENLLDESQKLKKYKQDLIEIENNIEPKIENVFKKIKVLQEERISLRERFDTILETLRNNRTLTATNISSNNSLLKLEIIPKSDFKDFETFLTTLVIGQNVQSKQLELIIGNKTEPSQLCEFAKNNSIDEFIRESKTTAHTAGTIISKLRGEYDLSPYGLTPVNKNIFDLELIYLKDKINIELFDQDTDRFKKFNKFSPGQQCSALLSILLMASDKPLIIDQPEDELDWDYILDFIDKLKLCKSDGEKVRQFIFVTHNQNITVLGESEKIIKVKHIASDDGEKGTIVSEGSIERLDVKDAVLTLEGGEEAFKKRLRKYGIDKAS